MMDSRDDHPTILIVVSIDAIGVARLPGIFHRAGYVVDVLARQRTAVLASRFVSNRRVVAGGPVDVAQALAEGLPEFTKTYDWILPADEPLLEAIAERPDRELMAARMPLLPRPAIMDEVLSKIKFLTRAVAVGLPIPEFEICHTHDEIVAAVAKLGYPVVLKRERSMAGSGVRVARDPAGLAQGIAQLGQADIMVQRCIQGRIGGATILMEHGVPIRYFAFYKLFNWPTILAPSGGGELVEDPEIDALVDKVGEMEQFHGLCSIDWMREDGTGKIYLIEFNPRSTPSTYASGWAGSDFIPVLRGMHRERPRAEQIRPRGGAGRIFRMFPESAFRAIDDRDLCLFLRSLGSAPWGDPVLLLAVFRRLVGHYVPTGWKIWKKWSGVERRNLHSRPPL